MLMNPKLCSCDGNEDHTIEPTIAQLKEFQLGMVIERPIETEKKQQEDKKKTAAPLRDIAKHTHRVLERVEWLCVATAYIHT